MEAAGIVFFLDRDTAESVLTGYNLEGDGVHIGVRDVEFRSSGFSVVDVYANATERTQKCITYMYGDVPIYVHIYKSHPTIEGFDIRNYCNEFWNLPNTWERFLSVKKDLQ